MASIHTAVSTEDTFYQWWQVEALHNSFQHVQQPGQFTALVAERSEGELRQPWSVPVQRTRHYAQQGDDYYVPHNKPGSLQEWLNRATVNEQTILLLDPDCLFTRVLVHEVQPGRLMSQFVGYINPFTSKAHRLGSRFCRRNRDKVQPIGIPTFIHQDDLRAIVPRWFELSIAIRGDREASQLAGWVAEMWAFCFAVAEADIEVVVANDYCQTSLDDVDERPLIHYCYALKDERSGFTWDKRQYKPWSALPSPTPGMTRGSRMTLKELERVSASFGHRLVEPVGSRSERQG